jgi:NAD(P)-dependent dehydrogenase (short-subunit alcohol dehydrogenase family)
MQTPMTEPAGQIDWSHITSRIPLGRLVTTSEVAAAIAFLASEQAAAVNGATLVVDGGYLAHRYPI